MHLIRLVLVILTLGVLVQCSAELRTDGTTMSLRSAVCVAEWDPTWRQGSGANEWWVEYEIEGGPVASAYLEVPGVGIVPLSNRWNKWVGASTFRIPAGTAVSVYAATTNALRAHTSPFSYLHVDNPSTDHCTTGGGSGVCDEAFRPVLRQGSGANEWWVEYVISASRPVTRAYLELPSGTTVPLAYEHQKWRGAPNTRIPTGTMVIAHAETATGEIAQTEPLAYLIDTQPRLKPCPAACPEWAPTWREGTGANEWWVEYVISGPAKSAYLELPGGARVALAYEQQKWRGAPGVRIPTGATVIMHAESTTAESVQTEPFRYLVDRTPETKPCPGIASYADIGGAETGPDVFHPGEVLYDAANDKVLLLGETSGRPSMRRCNPDGTGCTAHLLDAGRGPGSGSAGSAVIDGSAQKLLFVSNVSSPDSSAPSSPATGLALFRCELDGSGCVARDVSGGVENRGLHSPALAIDSVNHRLVVGTCTTVAEGESRASITRCGLDGNGCTRTDISAAGSGAMCQENPALVLDATAQKLLFFARDETGAAPQLRLTRCDLDVSDCSHHVLPAPDRIRFLSAVLDDATRKLAVVISVPGSVGEALSIVSCNADGTACALRTLSWGGWARARIIAGELVMSVADPWGQGEGPVLLRCDVAGAVCSATPLALDRFWSGPSSHVAPLAHDPVRDVLLVGTALHADDGIPPYELAPLLLRQPRGGGAHTQHDVSAGPGESLYTGQRLAPDAAYIDEVSRKILALGFTQHVGMEPSRRIRRPLTRCNLDGTGCIVTETDTGERILGIAGGRLYFLGIWRGDPRETENTSVLELLRCNVDGTSCSRTEIQRPMAEGASEVLAALDPLNGMALIVLPNEGLRRCPLDGSPCLAPVALPPSFVLGAEAIAIDAYRGKLLLVSTLQSVLRCDLDGTACAERAFDPGASGSRFPKLLVDAEGVYLVSAEGSTGTGDYNGIAVYACAPDVTGCARRTLALGAGGHGIRTFSATLDRTANNLLVATEDTARLRRPTAYVCDRDGSRCVELDLSAGQPTSSGARPTALFDSVDRRLHIVTSNEALLSRPSLFSIRP